ncbi:proline dehydrogenase family protein [soil metagenome]
MFTRAVVGVTGLQPVESIITGTRAGRRLAHRFVAGDTLVDAIDAAEKLESTGLFVSLDLLGEEVEDEDGARRAASEYLACLQLIAESGMRANISVKLTQLGLNIDTGLAEESVDRLALAAAACGTSVTIDMEDSRYTAATIDLYADAQSRHGNLGVCLQACLRRTPEDLVRLLPLGGHLRLCKGAYLEPEDIAFQAKDDVDAAFGRLLVALMEAATVRPAIATHDPRLIDLTLDLAERRAAPFEFQMLYGVRADEQKRLAGAGHDVRVYLPFGSAWYPYLTRRLAERPANTWFFLRSLAGR